MAINFPTSLDNFTNPSSGNTLDSPSHSLQHSDANDAIEAIEAKLGVGNSPAGSATAGQVLTISAAGTSTWTTPSADGLIQIVPSSVSVGSGSGSANSNGLVTFSGCSSVSLNGVFSSTYKDYIIQLNFTGTTDNTFAMRLRNASTDNSSANYYSVGFYQTIASATPTGQGYGGPATYWWIGETRNGLQQSNVIYIHQPFDTAHTTMNQQMLYGGSTTAGQVCSTGSMSVTTSYDGFTLYPLSGNITGSIAIYGFRS